MIKEGAHPRYQASPQHPCYLERIEADGRVILGQFSNGVFIPESTTK